MSRPQYQPTPEQRRQVQVMTGLGLTQADISRWLDVDPKTLRLHFRRELDTGEVEANMRVAQSLYAMATRDKNVAAAIWWTKARMGWKDLSRIEHTGAEGGPMESYVVVAPPVVDETSDWLKQYGPKTIEGQADE